MRDVRFPTDVMFGWAAEVTPKSKFEALRFESAFPEMRVLLTVPKARFEAFRFESVFE